MKKTQITKTHCPDTFAYCDTCSFPTKGKQPTIAELRSRARKHVEKTGHIIFLQDGVKVSIYARAC